MLAGEGKHTTQARKVNATTQGNWKWNPEFYKKEELEENSFYSFKPIEDMKLWGTK